MTTITKDMIEADAKEMDRFRQQYDRQELSETDAQKLDAETLLSKYEGGWGGFRGFYRRSEEVFYAEKREASVLRKEILRRLQSSTNIKEG